MVHHVVNRGNRKATIFHQRGDFLAFMAVLSEAIEGFEMRLIAFCIMRNHWHLVLWPDEDVSVSAFMHWLTSTHVRRYHTFHGLTGTGHLYQDRFTSDICRDDRGVLAVIRYVEGNPIAAGIVERGEDYEWSSLALRVHGDPQGLLTPPPIVLPSNWTAFVNEYTPRPDTATRFAV
jgi:putative transposase